MTYRTALVWDARTQVWHRSVTFFKSMMLGFRATCRGRTVPHGAYVGGFCFRSIFPGTRTVTTDVRPIVVTAVTGWRDRLVGWCRPRTFAGCPRNSVSVGFTNIRQATPARTVKNAEKTKPPFEHVLDALSVNYARNTEQAVKFVKFTGENGQYRWVWFLENCAARYETNDETCLTAVLFLKSTTITGVFPRRRNTETRGALPRHPKIHKFLIKIISAFGN